MDDAWPRRARHRSNALAGRPDHQLSARTTEATRNRRCFSFGNAVTTCQHQRREKSEGKCHTPTKQHRNIGIRTQADIDDKDNERAQNDNPVLLHATRSVSAAMFVINTALRRQGSETSFQRLQGFAPTDSRSAMPATERHESQSVFA